jgi:DNA-binding MarR family transcriptional regulator
MARQRGLTCQSVQRTVDRLAQEGGMAFADTPHHQRATLVDFTPRGRRIMKEVHQLQTTWTDDLAQGLSAPGLHDALQRLEALRRRLDVPA